MQSLSGDELSHAKKALRKLTSKRMAKIVRMASLSPLTHVVSVKITSEETELYNSIFRSCNKFKDITKGEQNVKE